MSESKRGGARTGAGRPPAADRRVRRGVAFNTIEWETIRSKAAERNMSIRAYLVYLAEADGGVVTSLEA
jgi:hypothetical protein